MTGVAHVTAEFPFDTIKSRYQTNPLHVSYRTILRELQQPSVLRDASRALIPALTRAVIAHSASFFALQKFKEHFL